MNNNRVSLLLPCLATTLSFVASAKTIAWYHFDDAEPYEVLSSENNPGVASAVNPNGYAQVKGTIYAIGGTDGDSYYGVADAISNDLADVLPRFEAPGCGLPYVYDPVTGVTNANRASLHFRTREKSKFGGSVNMLAESKFAPDDLTVECFVCTTGGTFNTFAPIFGRRANDNWTNESLALYMTSNGKLEVRGHLAGASGATVSGTSGHGTAINDGFWHHVAYTYRKSTTNITVYVDYKKSFECKITETKNASSSKLSYTAGKAFVVGGYAFKNSSGDANGNWRKFTGWIDEVRISDAALTPDQFLRQYHPCIDQDTLFYLPFDGEPGVRLSVVEGGSKMPNLLAFVGGNDSRVSPPDRGITLYNETSGSAGTLPRPEYSADVPFAQMAPGPTAKLSVPNRGSLRFHANSNTSTPGGWSLYQQPTNTGIFAQQSTTVEFFFKTDVATTGTGAHRVMVKIDTSPLYNVMFYQDARNLSLCYNDKVADWNRVDVSGPNFYDDGRWHHFAAVYDMEAKTLTSYVDYVRVDRGSVTNVALKAVNSDIRIATGGNRAQFFDGWLDELRVTARALRPDEFLTRPLNEEELALEPGTLAQSDFNGDWKLRGRERPILNDVAVLGLRSGSKKTALPTLTDEVWRPVYMLDGRLGEHAATNTGSCAYDGGTVLFPNAKFFWHRPAYTLEWVMKIDEIAPTASLVRMSTSDNPDAGWASLVAYLPENEGGLSGQGKLLKVRTFAKGTNTADYDTAYYLPFNVIDSHFHHYALTLEEQNGQTTISLFLDYKKVGEVVRPYLIEYDGRVVNNERRMANACTMSLGTNPNGDVKATCDFVRVSDGILSPTKFMRRPALVGLQVIAR